MSESGCGKWIIAGTVMIGNVVRQVMGSVGIALAATLLTHAEATYHAVLVVDASGPVCAAMGRFGDDGPRKTRSNRRRIME